MQDVCEERAALPCQPEGVLYNTYWIRFGRGGPPSSRRWRTPECCLKQRFGRGVGRIVHFSVVNASADSALPYFRGKGQVEEILKETGIPYAIIRPTLVFGEGDLLLNNMAWRCGASRCSRSSGKVTTRCSPSTPRTWRPRRLMAVRGQTALSPTPQGRINTRQSQIRC